MIPTALGAHVALWPHFNWFGHIVLYIMTVTVLDFVYLGTWPWQSKGSTDV